jgi:hypothetical protein
MLKPPEVQGFKTGWLFFSRAFFFALAASSVPRLEPYLSKVSSTGKK